MRFDDFSKLLLHFKGYRNLLAYGRKELFTVVISFNENIICKH